MAKKMSKAQLRNEEIQQRMKELFTQAGEKQYNEVPKLKPEVELLFSTHEWGFREIVLLIVIVKLRDPSYDAGTNFYACNPRAIYEGPIRAELTDRKIPSRQSGPLNIAKSVQGINSAWAAPRQPAAKAVVRLIEHVNGLNHEDLTNFAIWIHAKFLEVASETAALTVVVPPNSDPVILAHLCHSLIEQEPDGGNTPQRIVGYLLEAYHEEAGTGITVKGHTDRASTTSTTSGKPGDVAEYTRSETLLAVYEVTVKGFGEKRVQEAYEAIVAVSPEDSLLIPTVTVLCRPIDKHPEVTVELTSASFLGEYEYKALRFFFIDLFEWITLQLLRMPVSGRLRFYKKLEEYVRHQNTAIKVKEHWRVLRTESDLPSSEDE